MSWIYIQKTGDLIHNGDAFTTGYAGKYTGKNNPEMQNVKDTGPLPCGTYRIGDAYNHHFLGSETLNLTPDAANEMFGRSEFRIHGDSIANPGMASEGCIVIPYSARHELADFVQQGDRMLEVVATRGGVK